MKQIERLTVKCILRPWGSERVIGETAEYMGKILRYRAGQAGGLQLHRTKDETFHLVSGKASVWFEAEGGDLEVFTMRSGGSVHVPAGAPHRFEAITDCVVFEVSTPVHDDRVRLEEHYGVEVIGDAYGLETMP